MTLHRLVAHLREALHWSTGERVEAAEVAAAALGMAAPVLLGVATGHVGAGFAAALGSLAVGRVEPGAGAVAHFRREGATLAPAVAAASVVFASHGLGPGADVVPVAAALIAAVGGGFDRASAEASVRFAVFLGIAAALPVTDAHTAIADVALLVGGAVWTSLAAFVLSRPARRDIASAEPKPARRATARQKFDRWRHSLATLEGWDYALRLALGLAPAAILAQAFPTHRLHWIGLTVALLTPRRPVSGLLRTTQRTLGTAVGLVATGLVLAGGLPPLALVAAVGVLAGARPMLRSRSYLAHSALMTPLVVSIIDAGRPPEAGLLVDRLVATLVGAILVGIGDVVFDRLRGRPRRGS